VRLKEDTELDLKAQLHQVNESVEMLKSAEVGWQFSVTFYIILIQAEFFLISLLSHSCCLFLYFNK